MDRWGGVGGEGEREGEKAGERERCLLCSFPGPSVPTAGW